MVHHKASLLVNIRTPAATHHMQVTVEEELVAALKEAIRKQKHHLCINQCKLVQCNLMTAACSCGGVCQGT